MLDLWISVDFCCQKPPFLQGLRDVFLKLFGAEVFETSREIFKHFFKHIKWTHETDSSREIVVIPAPSTLFCSQLEAKLVKEREAFKAEKDEFEASSFCRFPFLGEAESICERGVKEKCVLFINYYLFFLGESGKRETGRMGLFFFLFRIWLFVYKYSTVIVTF